MVIQNPTLTLPSLILILFSSTILTQCNPNLHLPPNHLIVTNHSNHIGMVTQIVKIPTTKQTEITLDELPRNILPGSLSFRVLGDFKSELFLKEPAFPSKLTPGELFHQNLNRTVELKSKDQKIYTGVFLGISSEEFILLIQGKPTFISAKKIQQIRFDEASNHVPTLQWQLNTPIEFPQNQLPVEFTYQIDQIYWYVDYTLVLNTQTDTAHLSGWATVVNNSDSAITPNKLSLFNTQMVESWFYSKLGTTPEVPIDKDHTTILQDSVYRIEPNRVFAFDAHSDSQLEFIAPISDLPITQIYRFQPEEAPTWAITTPNITNH